ncbi:MAG: gfo/Idh/MocA family oxidoreductase, partial [Candidatus Sumerlaeia bacterium]|nr:gfo/Idh/MocA family oxidoreductase [Candidatus Sumerlaeia bacterium]
EMIWAGEIGAVTEVHAWTNRPIWPQGLQELPGETSVPSTFDWDLWLGPSLPRPYHPHYTHAVFRGWYEFGGGSLADMGHYSLWPVFQEFALDAPVLVESTPSHLCAIADGVSKRIQNDYSFPAACTIRFRFAAKGDRPAVDLFWYDGGIKPPTPEELLEDKGELPAEGMLWVGDKGKILAGFRCENPKIIPERKSRDYTPPKGQKQDRARSGRTNVWIEAFKSGKPTFGNFLLGGPISEAFNLGAVSLRLGGKRLLWDAQTMKVTNLPSANKYLTREYRKGWELSA